MKILITAFFTLAATTALAQSDCNMSPEVSAACADLDVADKELNAAYKELITNLSKSSSAPSAKQKLIQAQRAWLRFRELDCELVPEITSGTSSLPLTIFCEAEHATTRAKQLRALAEGL